MHADSTIKLRDDIMRSTESIDNKLSDKQKLSTFLVGIASSIPSAIIGAGIGRFYAAEQLNEMFEVGHNMQLYVETASQFTGALVAGGLVGGTGAIITLTACKLYNKAYNKVMR